MCFVGPRLNKCFPTCFKENHFVNFVHTTTVHIIYFSLPDYCVDMWDSWALQTNSGFDSLFGLTFCLAQY